MSSTSNWSETCLLEGIGAVLLVGGRVLAPDDLRLGLVVDAGRRVGRRVGRRGGAVAVVGTRRPRRHHHVDGVLDAAAAAADGVLVLVGRHHHLQVRLETFWV